MRIQISEHFTYHKLLRFVCPSVIMMVFTSVYGVVDGIFVSNFVGSTAFAAVNFIMPVLMGLGAVGFMLGTGGGALAAKTMGEGLNDKANEYFSMIVYVNIGAGIILTLLGLALIRPIAGALGAEGEMLDNAVSYGRVMLLGTTPYMLQNSFQSFFPVAEKPKAGLAVTVAAGVTNIVLDALFVGALSWGITGAAAATIISYFVGGILPVFYFAGENSSRLRLVKTRIYWKKLLQSCINGSSEMMTNLSMSLVNMLYNIQLMKMAGENGVAAYGVIMYVNFIFAAVFLGYSIGSAPIAGYQYGAENHKELHNILKKSLVLLIAAQIIMFAAAQLLSGMLAQIFVGYDPALKEMTQHGFRIFAFSFLFMGINIYGSAFFTALNNGGLSALISFLRTLLFQVIAVFALPVVFGLNGIWSAVVAAEVAAMVVTLIILAANRKKYGY